MFTLALLLSTWTPMAFFVAIGSLGTKPAGGVETVRTALLLVGGLHVAATLLLYVDKKFLRLASEHKARYVYVPLALIGASGFIFAAGGAVTQVCTYLVFWPWQAHHYGRQNIGVYSFAWIARGWRPESRERRALDLAAACGICGTFHVLARDVAPRALLPVFEAFYWLGAVGFLGVLIFSLSVYVKHRRDFSWTRTTFFFTLVVFFVPMFLSDNLDVAFFSYAIAHGVQYLAFMGVLSLDLGAREGRHGVSGRMVAVAASMVMLVFVGTRTADLKAFATVAASPILTTMLDFLAGVGLGTTIAHFVIDAGAWRLSEPSVRHYVTDRFGFLFERAVAPAHRKIAVSLEEA